MSGENNEPILWGEDTIGCQGLGVLEQPVSWTEEGVGSIWGLSKWWGWREADTLEFRPLCGCARLSRVHGQSGGP